MCQWEVSHVDIILVGGCDVGERQQGTHQIAVRDHHSFRGACRTARVHYNGRVICLRDLTGAARHFTQTNHFPVGQHVDRVTIACRNQWAQRILNYNLQFKKKPAINSQLICEQVAKTYQVGNVRCAGQDVLELGGQVLRSDNTDNLCLIDAMDQSIISQSRVQSHQRHVLLHAAES